MLGARGTNATSEAGRKSQAAAKSFKDGVVLRQRRNRKAPEPRRPAVTSATAPALIDCDECNRSFPESRIMLIPGEEILLCAECHSQLIAEEDSCL